MNFLNDLAKAVGFVIDKAVPFAVGSRTKIAVVACPILSTVAPGIVAVYPAAAPMIPVVQALLCTSAPLFALAGLVRAPAAAK
jgi:hypothetical protein